MNTNKFFLVLLLFFSTFMKSQTSIHFGAEDSVSKQNHHPDSGLIHIKAINWDTNMYRKYDYVFIVGLFSQHRDFGNEIEQKINRDTANLSKHSYVAESNVIGGISLSYDKFQISFGTRSKPRDDRAEKGYTKAFNIGFNFGDNRWVSENYYRRFQGFYNKNGNAVDTSNGFRAKYYLQPGMVSSLLMSRLMYFKNYENFSFKSGFGCNYRQLKSAITWVFGASYSYYNLINDSSIVPKKSRALFNDYANMNGLRSANLGINIGAAGTLVVFKAWFISGYFTLGPEQQWRQYEMGSFHKNISYVSWSGTSRISVGLNLKKFYILFSNTNDYSVYNSAKSFSHKSESITQNFTFGWRFHSGAPPKFYKKFQKTGFYKLFG